MVYVHMALRAEAKALIAAKQLKKIAGPPFEIYGNDDILLIISGTGMIRTAAAVSYLLAAVPPCKNNDIAVNIGICGQVGRNGRIGDIIIANKIMDNVTGKVCFPDILIKHPFREGSVETFPNPVTEGANVECEYVDMEAAAFFETASFYMPAHRIFSFKVVSDYLDTEFLSKQYVSKLVEYAIPHVFDYIELLKASLVESCDILTQEEHEIIAGFCSRNRFTVSMANKLLEYARYFKLRHGFLKRDIFINSKLTKTKAQALELLGEITRELARNDEYDG